MPASHVYTVNGQTVNRWSNNSHGQVNARILLGSKDQTIDYNTLPTQLKSDNLYNNLFPDEETTTTSNTAVPVNDLGFDPNNIISHIQTRDSNFRWQTYYSTVPSLPGFLILTHAQSTNLTGEVEKLIHKHLDEYRLRSNREFFKADLKILKKTVQEFLNN